MNLGHVMHLTDSRRKMKVRVATQELKSEQTGKRSRSEKKRVREYVGWNIETRYVNDTRKRLWFWVGLIMVSSSAIVVTDGDNNDLVVEMLEEE